MKWFCFKFWFYYRLFMACLQQIYLMLYGGTGTKAEQALENIEETERHEREDRLSRRSRRRQSRERARSGVPVSPEELESSSSSDDEAETAEAKTISGLTAKARVPDVIREEEEECRKYVYVGTAVEDSNKDLESADTQTPVAPPRRNREFENDLENGRPTFDLDEGNQQQQPNTANGDEGEGGSGEESDTNSTSRWIDRVPGVPKVIRNRFRRSGSSNGSTPAAPPPQPPWVPPRQDEDNHSVASAWSRFRGAISNVSMPSMPRFTRSASNDANSTPQIDILKPDFTNTYDILDPKKAAKREKRDRKELTRRVRKRIKEELREAARIERKRRMVTDAIELTLQLLRMLTSFAVLVGNIRKTFLPAQIKYLRPGQNHYDHPWLLTLFRITTFMDVTMFSINFLWAYCLQWHLCCRLGLVRFWFWTILLVTIAISTMIYPMTIAMDQMDLSWCHFKNGTKLAEYQPKWRLY